MWRVLLRAALWAFCAMAMLSMVSLTGRVTTSDTVPSGHRLGTHRLGQHLNALVLPRSSPYDWGDVMVQCFFLKYRAIPQVHFIDPYARPPLPTEALVGGSGSGGGGNVIQGGDGGQPTAGSGDEQERPHGNVTKCLRTSADTDASLLWYSSSMRGSLSDRRYSHAVQAVRAAGVEWGRGFLFRTMCAPMREFAVLPFAGMSSHTRAMVDSGALRRACKHGIYCDIYQSEGLFACDETTRSMSPNNCTQEDDQYAGYWKSTPFAPGDEYVVSFVTHCTVDRLPMLLRVALAHWQGPMSVAVLVSGPGDQEEALRVVDESTEARRWVDLHFVATLGAFDADSYPFNTLRNVAAAHAPHEYHAVLDADVVLPISAPELGRLMARVESEEVPPAQNRCPGLRAFFLPTFSIPLSEVSQNDVVEIIAGIRALTSLAHGVVSPREDAGAGLRHSVTRLLRLGKLLPMAEHFAPGYYPVDYPRWLGLEAEDESAHASELFASELVYEIVPRRHFEAYYVTRNNGYMPFAESFVERNGDAAQQVQALAQAGYRFFVLRSVLALNQHHEQERGEKYLDYSRPYYFIRYSALLASYFERTIEMYERRGLRKMFPAAKKLRALLGRDS